MALALKTLAQVTVATSGTEQRLTSNHISNVEAIYISAPAANTGSIYVGDSSVATTRGIEIPKGTSFTIMAPRGDMINIRDIYVDAANNGDKCNITYLQRVV